MESFKIAAYNMDSTAVVFEVTKFFLADNKRLPLFDQNSASLEDEKYGKLELKAILKRISLLSGISMSLMITWKLIWI